MNEYGTMAEITVTGRNTEEYGEKHATVSLFSPLNPIRTGLRFKPCLLGERAMTIFLSHGSTPITLFSAINEHQDLTI